MTDVDAFIDRHALPAAIRPTLERCYRPLAAWLARRAAAGDARLVGVSGAQGTGKTTLADFLVEALEADHGLHAVTLSLDDFYLSRQDRADLARRVHPLLATRGVPGTHDVRALSAALDALAELPPGAGISLPRFDKATDERMPAGHERRLTGPFDLVLLEGWCVGVRPEPQTSLAEPVNRLEAVEDPDRTWRQYVNDRLAGDYADAWARLDTLIFLRVPGFDAVRRWRTAQERRLARDRNAAGGATHAVMTAERLNRFVAHYERLTRAALRDLPTAADAVLELDRGHACAACRYRDASGG